MVLLSLAVSQLVLFASAFSWRRGHLQPPPSDVSIEADKHSLTPLEMEALFLRTKYGDLEAYSQKPDCFRQAANLIRTHCSELDMDEDARIKAAIQMTLCELATARHHSPPLECAPFSFPREPWLPDTPSGSPGNCVEALSRSAQFWSSYSGYLREVPQLCYAFRRWNDIDTAKDIYKNATLEKLALIRFVSQREETALEHIRTSEAYLKEIRNVTGRMRDLDEVVALVSNQIRHQLSDGHDKTLEMFKDAIIAIQKQEENDRSKFLSQIDITLEQVLDRHSVALTALLPMLSATLLSNLDHLSAIIQGKNAAVLDLINVVDERWSSLSHHFTALHHTISHLIQTTSEASVILSAQSAAAQSAHILQVDANNATSELVATITQLTSAAHTEIDWINRTGIESREREAQRHVWERWTWNVIRWVGLVVWRVDSSSVEQFIHPVFHIMLLFASILRYIFQSAFSSLMGVLIVVLSSKTYFSKILASPNSRHVSLPPSDQPLFSLCGGIVPPTTTPPPPPIHHQHLSQSPKFPTLNPTALSPYRHPSAMLASHRFSRIPDRLCKPIVSP